jgi:uncharacterized protein (DUF1015 family)
MAGFHPFRGVRYAPAAVGPSLDAVICPPYDVISADDRAALVARHDHNAVRLEVPDTYEGAAGLLRGWLDAGVLAADAEPSFYAYRMQFADEDARPRSTTGILGALDLSPTGDVLPHEHTTPKDRADRLDLLRATRTNLSPVWMLTTAPLAPYAPAGTRQPDASAVDRDGVVHELWRLSDPGVVGAVQAAVRDAGPVLVADGHHRFEVANAYREETGAGGGQDRLLTFLVELADEQVAVRAIHRLLGGVPDGFDLAGALADHFDVTPTLPPDDTVLQRMADAGALALVTRDGTYLLRPTAATAAAAGHHLDSSRLDVAVAALRERGVPVELTFQHGWDLVAAAVDKGAAQAGVLLRPATVAQIAEVSRGGERMPPKTTFFHPKLATGMVFRSLDLD